MYHNAHPTPIPNANHIIVYFAEKFVANGLKKLNPNGIDIKYPNNINTITIGSTTFKNSIDTISSNIIQFCIS